MKILSKHYRLTLNFAIKVIVLLLTVPILLNACTEDEALEVISKLLPVEDIELSREVLDKVIYGPVKYTCDNSAVTVFNVDMNTVDFNCHQAPYSLIVVNGEVDGSYMLNKARILVDNQEIFNHTDFRMKVERLQDGVGFDANSIMRVEVTGEQGNYINIYFLGEQEEQSEVVANYPFNGDATSETCSAPAGVEHGGVTLTDDRFCTPNSAYLFDGDNDRISFGTFNDVYTMSLWFYNPTNITKGAFYGNLLQLDSGNPGGAGGISWGNSTDGVEGEIVVLNNSGTGTGYWYWTNIESVSIGWHHQVIMWDAAENNYRLYFDNADLGVASVGGSPVQEKDFANLEIGSDAGSWNGKVDEVKMYNYPLSAEEVSTLYSENDWSGNCNACDAVNNFKPIAYYPFSGNANDESINDNDGIVNGATPTSDRFGNPNSAYHFDGVDDYINFGSDNSLEVSEAISISVWIKPEQISVIPQLLTKEGEYKLSLDAENKIGYSLANTSPGWRTTVVPAGLELNKWTHILLTYSASSEKILIYKNNDLVYETTGDGSVIDSSPEYNELWIGFRQLRAARGIHFFQGGIDDVRLFNYALSPCEVENLYFENGWTGE